MSEPVTHITKEGRWSTTIPIGDRFEDERCPLHFSWKDGVVAKNGFIYAIPSGAPKVLKINPNTGCTSLVGRSLSTTRGQDKWEGGVFNPSDRCIYGTPSLSRRILKFDTITEKVSYVGRQLAQSPNYKYGSGVLVTQHHSNNNAKIYFFPFSANSVLCFDPVDESTSSIDISSLSNHDFKWSAAILAEDGCIYCIPFYATQVMRFNPRDHTFSLIGRVYEGGWKWRGGVLAPDGSIYGIPYHHKYILKINIITQTTELVGADLGPQTRKFQGGVLGYDSCIYMMPCDFQHVVRFNPITGLTSILGKSHGSSILKYYGGVRVPNSWWIYAIPYCAERVLRICSLDGWFYMKFRLLVQYRRATAVDLSAPDKHEQCITQQYITNTNDDIFRFVLDFLL